MAISLQGFRSLIYILESVPIAALYLPNVSYYFASTFKTFVIFLLMVALE